MWRQQVAALLVANELTASSAFWRHVAAARAGDSAYDLALRYARGKPRQAIAILLDRAAEAPDEPSARLALMQAGVRAVFTRPDPDPRPSRYAIASGYADRVRAGARTIARRGAHECLECGQAITDSDPGRRYCWTHESKLKAKRKAQLVRDARRALDEALPAILDGAWVSNDPPSEAARRAGALLGETVKAAWRLDVVVT